MIACPCGQVKTASLYPSANLKTICVQQQVMSLHFSTLCFIFVYIFITGPHANVQQGE